jgi:GMP synthase (glutamine-hydrolysing)
MDKIIVLDFGGQYCHLISRRIRDLGVYSEVKPASKSNELVGQGLSLANKSRPKGLPNDIQDIKGIILSGGAASVYDKNSPKCDLSILRFQIPDSKFKIPVLGICYGHQLIAYLDKGKVISGTAGEYGITELTIKKPSRLLKGFGKVKTLVWMNHKDVVKELPSKYSVIARTKNSPIAVFEDNKNKIYGVQFHPEVTHTANGMQILKNFVFDICRAKREWDTSQVISSIKQEIRDVIGKGKAVIGLSGGVDSSTAAILVKEVIGKNLIAVYVDTGLMRYQETELMRRIFADKITTKTRKHEENETFSSPKGKSFGLNLKIVDASERFFKALKGVTAPEKKRKIIGKLFIDVFDEVAIKEKAKVLIQGTIYSDRIESGITQHSSIIKSHHNVGGLPKNMYLEVFEPLKNLYKDEVRKIARKIGLLDEITKRHVFPGPGLAIRIVGDITPKKAEITRRASYIIEQELKKVGLYEKVWMSFAVLLPIKSVGIQGDARSYKYPIVIRIIESKDAMTANFAKIPYEILEKISTRITNEISEVNRVVYDISNKPPATMEWE